jgi:hypothetical protein
MARFNHTREVTCVVLRFESPRAVRFMVATGEEIQAERELSFHLVHRFGGCFRVRPC